MWLYVWIHMCVCMPSVNRKATCLLLQLCVFGLCISTCSSGIHFASSCSTHRQERGSRGEAYRGLKLSVFKGVSTPYFCIIHITPRRWSISRLQQESWAISWPDTAAADTQRQTHTHNIHHFYCQMRGWDSPCGEESCVAAFKTHFYWSDFWTRTLHCLQRKSGKQSVWE